MGEALEMAPQPRGRSAVLATVTLVFRHDGFFDSRNANRLALQYAAVMNDVFAKQNETYRFSLYGVDIEVAQLSAEVQEVRFGSIIATLTVIGSIVGTTYGAVAIYPQFKEGFFQIRKDLKAAVDWASTKSAFKPISVDIIRRDENGILEDLEIRK